MAATSVVICNNALTLIGSRRITALSDPSKEARVCNDNYDTCRKAVLRIHPWNFACERVELTGKTITNIVDSGAGLIKVTAASHGLSTGNYATIEGVVGTVEANITNVKVTVIDANNFTIDGSSFSNTYISGGKVSLAPGFEFIYKFALPSGCLRVLAPKDGSDEPLSNKEWKVEGAFLLTNYSTVRVRYINDVSDTTKFDSLFDEALAAYLAQKICLKITGSEVAAEGARRNLKDLMEKARFVDSTEDPAEVYDCDDWTRARHGAGDGFVRNPMTN
ncbi:tail tubular protein A [Caudoviricetes sp.]|nr:tail tubular protein A [Caudoviricetes sp.]